MNFLLSFTVLILLGTVQSHPFIGRSFYIPNYNLLSGDMFGGYTFFKKVPSTCLKTHKLHRNVDTDVFFSSTSSFYNRLSTHTSISADLKGAFTMGTTLDVTTQSISEDKRTVAGVTLDVHAARSVDYLEKSCSHELVLNENVRKSFENLPLTISEPWMQSSWREYMIFLNTYGSHIVREVVYGSSIYQHCFAESSRSYTKRQFAVKSCLEFEGPTKVGKLGIKVCGGISQEEINSVQRSQTSSFLVLRGGSPETRAQLHKIRSKDIIAKFLLEADKTHQPIGYKYIAVWTLLQSKYIGTEHFNKAINLEYFFKGFLNYDCKYRLDKSTVLQKFVNAPQGSSRHPAYKCIIAPDGCQSHHDCHYRHAFWCECRGDSCVRYYRGSGVQKTVAKVFRGSGWGWQGCSLGFFQCYCSSRNYHWKVVWGPNVEEMQFKIAVHERMKNMLVAQEKNLTEPLIPMNLDEEKNPTEPPIPMNLDEEKNPTEPPIPMNFDEEKNPTEPPIPMNFDDYWSDEM